MREVDLARHRDVVALPLAKRRRRPFADAVHRENDSLAEGRGIERARRVALMVLREKQPGLPVEILHPALELAFDQVLLEQFLLEPQRHRHAEGSEPARRESKIGLKQPLEFEKRLIIKSNIVDLVETAGERQTVFDGIPRKTGVLLFAREALFLGGGDNVT